MKKNILIIGSNSGIAENLIKKIQNKGDNLFTASRNEKCEFKSFKHFQIDLSILEDIKVNNYGLMQKTVYYGCSFEADLKQVDYQNFDKNHLDIETVNIPFLRQNYIKNIFYRNKKINDTKRLKNQLVRHKAILYKNSKVDKSSFDIVTYSENDINRSNETS